MKLIGITGKAGAGKDTLANLIYAKAQGSRPYIYSLATPIKQMVSLMLGCPYSQWEDRAWKEGPCELLGGRSPRNAAQTLGTEWGRHTFGEWVWLDIATKRIKEWGADVTVVPDIRFHNEAVWLKELGGTLIHVVRPEFEGLTAEAAQHSSEAGIGIIKPHITIWNRGSLADFQEEAFSILKAYSLV